MVLKDLGDAAGRTPLLVHHFAEKGDVGVRVVPRLIHVLYPQIISFSFGAAVELQERKRNAEIERLGDTHINRIRHGRK